MTGSVHPPSEDPGSVSGLHVTADVNFISTSIWISEVWPTSSRALRETQRQILHDDVLLSPLELVNPKSNKQLGASMLRRSTPVKPAPRITPDPGKTRAHADLLPSFTSL